MRIGEGLRFCAAGLSSGFVFAPGSAAGRAVFVGRLVGGFFRGDWFRRPGLSAAFGCCCGGRCCGGFGVGFGGRRQAPALGELFRRARPLNRLLPWRFQAVVQYAHERPAVILPWFGSGRPVNEHPAMLNIAGWLTTGSDRELALGRSAQMVFNNPDLRDGRRGNAGSPTGVFAYAARGKCRFHLCRINPAGYARARDEHRASASRAG